MAIMVGLSFEVLMGNHLSYSSWYLWLQLIVCIVYIVDFIWVLAVRHKVEKSTIWYNFLLLLISIPYLNIFAWTHFNPERWLSMAVAALPVVRSFVAMCMVLQWVLDGKVVRIFGQYVLTVLGFTYLAALMFYDYEIGVNPNLNGFGNAMWWACMNVTTVGAAVFPVTAVGKVLAALLPAIGMMFFPIFTIYVTNIYNVKHSDNPPQNNK
ncbi:MAG: two pore domain potassium channel family protein [Alistipes sp.]|nr:two pore domain potassium channel family protein [Alistipes sp.]